MPIMELTDSAHLCCILRLIYPFPSSSPPPPHTDCAGIFSTPSPKAYNSKRVHTQWKMHTPTDSIGAHPQDRRKDTSPSPNSCTRPPLLKSHVPNKQTSSSYSMTGRPVKGSFTEDLAKSPGPKYYATTGINTYLRRAPAFSISHHKPKDRGEYGDSCRLGTLH